MKLPFVLLAALGHVSLFYERAFSKRGSIVGWIRTLCAAHHAFTPSFAEALSTGGNPARLGVTLGYLF